MQPFLKQTGNHFRFKDYLTPGKNGNYQVELPNEGGTLTRQIEDTKVDLKLKVAGSNDFQKRCEFLAEIASRDRELKLKKPK